MIEGGTLVRCRHHVLLNTASTPGLTDRVKWKPEKNHYYVVRASVKGYDNNLDIIPGILLEEGSLGITTSGKEISLSEGFFEVIAAPVGRSVQEFVDSCISNQSKKN